MKNGLVVFLVLLLAFSLYRKNQTSIQPTGDSGEKNTAVSSKKSINKVPYVHKVVKGEGLWHISDKELGSGEKWGKLAESNGIKKPYVLYVGQEIKIPGKETEVITEGTADAVYTMAQLTEHNSKENCWLAIEGNVYDVTPFIASGFHPGKLAILLGCGKDATTLFNTRPMGSGTAHSERARKSLPKYLIGELAK